MIVDTHQHFWIYDPVRDNWIDDSMQAIRRDFLPADLQPVLVRNQVDACIAVQADQSENETKFLLNLADKNSFIHGVIGWVDLCAENVAERLAYFSKHPKFKGVRHIVQAEDNDFLLRKDFQTGISKLANHALIYEILIKKEQLPNAVKLVDAFPDQIFVLDHIAKPNIKAGELKAWKSHIEQLAARENVYAKLSGLVTEADWKNWQFEDFTPYLDTVFKAFGTDRLMFGSDWPVSLLAADYQSVKSIIEKYISGFSEEEKNKIMGNNAINIYRL